MKDSFDRMSLGGYQADYFIDSMERFSRKVIMGIGDQVEIVPPRITWRARSVGSMFHLFKLPLMMAETNSSVCGRVDDMQTVFWYCSQDEPALETRCALCQRWSLMDELSQ